MMKHSAFLQIKLCLYFIVSKLSMVYFIHIILGNNLKIRIHLCLLIFLLKNIVCLLVIILDNDLLDNDLYILIFYVLLYKLLYDK